MTPDDMCTAPAFLDAWEACFQNLPLELLRKLSLLNRTWYSRILAHFRAKNQHVHLGLADCTQGNAMFLLNLVHRLKAPLINRTVTVGFEGAEAAAEPKQWQALDLHGWVQKHLALRSLEPTDGKWEVEEDTPIAAAFLLGRAMAALCDCDPEKQEGRCKIGVRLPQPLSQPNHAVPLKWTYVQAMTNTWHPTIHNWWLDREAAGLLSKVAITALSGSFLINALSVLRCCHNCWSKITLKNRYLDDEGANVVSRAMRNMKATPRELDLTGTVTSLSMGVLGTMCDLLPRGAAFKTHLLHTLTLSHNHLGYEGTTRLARMIMSCRWKQLPALKNLDLQNCGITCAAMEQLAPCFATEMLLGGLVRLGLTDNPISNSGLRIFQSHATGMTKLKHLYFGGALFTVNACEDFALWIKDEAKWDGIEVVLTGGCFFSESQHTIMLWVRARELLNAAIAVRKAECNFKQMLPKRLRA